ncbi:hypothetical protein M758_9G008700 [Ceratodon purpureus]|nr:hypothetical protein M758_9G008700 [Ceratodon purpureus]
MRCTGIIHSSLIECVFLLFIFCVWYSQYILYIYSDSLTIFHCSLCSTQFSYD